MVYEHNGTKCLIEICCDNIKIDVNLTKVEVFNQQSITSLIDGQLTLDTK